MPQLAEYLARNAAPSSTPFPHTSGRRSYSLHMLNIFMSHESKTDLN